MRCASLGIALGLVIAGSGAGRADYTCRKSDLRSCVAEIVRVDREIRRRVQSGHPGNLGTSLVGCYNECIGKHFPTDTPEQCTGSKARFAQITRTNAAFGRTDLRDLLVERCDQAR